MRKRDHSTASSCHIQKACDEWLTTRNKSKIQPRVVPYKKHPSALRHRQNFTASTLVLTQSPPPTKLKTCIKQSSILSFFQSSGRTNATEDKETYQPGPNSSIVRDKLSVSDCEDCSLACTGDQGLPSLNPGEQNLHRSMVFTDAREPADPGREDDIDIPDSKKRKLHMERASSKMYYCQETMEFIASNSGRKGSKFYTSIGGPNNESQSADIDSNGPNNDSKSIDIDSNGLNNESQSADIDSNGPNNDSKSIDIDSNGLNNESQSADIDSNGPNNDSKSIDIDSNSNGLNNESQSAEIDSNGPESQNIDIDSNGPRNDSQSSDIHSNGLNNESHGSDIDSNRPLNDSPSFDIDSDNFDRAMSSESPYRQPKKERTVSHYMDTLNNFCDDPSGYFVHSLEGSSEIIANSVDTVNSNQLEPIGSLDSNIYSTHGNNHSVMEGKCSGSKKQNSLQLDSLSLSWSQSDKVPKRCLLRDSETSSDSISDISMRFTSQPEGHDSPRIYTQDEFQFKSMDSLDKHDSIHVDSEFTLRFQREKYDRRERLSRLVSLQSSGSHSSIEFSSENDSQY
ncbi:hypothetical protein CHS0354_023287 [Potamilus streckersoni]|uniref:Uncharacterized protein n=1 Tax=Potamilus streckersoni TaxID=2493646 RepID=A0AAE0W794_9BIVA|nr:hypothetical protein CHS0354_023287 [Potamilus streckersoni]